MENRNVILEKSLDFSVSIIKFCEKLEEQKKFVIAKQLLRCGTSIGANVFESQHAESRLDFIHKMKIALKEANETYYWLILCQRSENYHADKMLISDVQEIIRILSKIIVSSKIKVGKT